MITDTFTDDEALWMAVRAYDADRASVRQNEVERMLRRLPVEQRPDWLVDRLAAAARAAPSHAALGEDALLDSCIELSRAEMFELAGLLLGISEEDLDDAIRDYASGLESGEVRAPRSLRRRRTIN